MFEQINKYKTEKIPHREQCNVHYVKLIHSFYCALSLRAGGHSQCARCCAMARSRATRRHTTQRHDAEKRRVIPL